MHVVLFQPEIPANTGNVARLCAATQSTLHLIEPLGFRLDDTELKRAGMDYWQYVKWHKWESWTAFKKGSGCRLERFWFVECGGSRVYSDVQYESDDVLIFGRETLGLPSLLLKQNRAQWLSIPMYDQRSRSLNLSNSVSLVLYESLRQQGFKGSI